ncbi:hypothetical protein G6011_11324 [Alternaria panax]|uniref:Uncharacterized protein n=1 Tax=Alternaria panax TaxID=48097 RepID=A0AAD4IDF7_9PLEO|nr:hypothetical protein G6011_11324 [Alternaria panax]
MVLAILPAFIVSFVVLVALVGTYYIYRACKHVRPAVPDVERARHIENMEHFYKQPIQLRNIERPQEQYHSDRWYGSENVVPEGIAPVAKPLPHIPEVKYTGIEGLLSPAGRVFLSTETFEGSKAKAKESDYFQEQDLHAERPWNIATDSCGNSLVEQPDLASPKPVRTVIRKPNTEPVDTAYDSAQVAAANIWDKINKGELQPSRRKPDKKLPKLPNVPTQEVLRDPAEFKNDVLKDVDLGSSTKEWAKAKVSSAYVTKRPSKRKSSDSAITAVDPNNWSIERPVSYVERKQNIESEAAEPTRPLDRAAETRRKILEATTRVAEKKKQEEKDRQAEERRQHEEQLQRAAEQQRLAEEKQRQKDEDRSCSLRQVTTAEFVNQYDTNETESLRPTTNRTSNSSVEAKRERKNRERPLTRSRKRSYTFSSDTTTTANGSVMNKKPSDSRSGTARSMSMNDQKRPDLNATMPSIGEGVSAGGTDERGIDDSRTRKTADPFSDKMARHSDGFIRKSASSGSSSRYNNGRAISRDAIENSFTSVEDAKVSFVPAQRSSGTSSNESRSQAQRCSNASTNDSRISSEGIRTSNYPERNNSKFSAQSHASSDSQSSEQSTSGQEKPERKSSLASRTFSKLIRKSSSDKKKERGSASSTQSWERNGSGLRGGGKDFVEEPEQISAPEDEHGYGHGHSRKLEEERKNKVMMRGGAGEKATESGSESGIETEKDDESDAGKIAHSGGESLEHEHPENDDDAEEYGSTAGDVSDDDATRDEYSMSEGSDLENPGADSSEDGSEDEGSDDGHEQTLLQSPFETSLTKTESKVKP